MIVKLVFNTRVFFFAVCFLFLFFVWYIIAVEPFSLKTVSELRNGEGPWQLTVYPYSLA